MSDFLLFQNPSQFFLLQYTAIRQWVPVCSMVDCWGAAAIEAIENFEKCEKKEYVYIH